MGKITKYIVEDEGQVFDFTYLKNNIEKLNGETLKLERPRVNNIFAKFSSGENDYQRHFEICNLLDRYSIMVGSFQASLYDCFTYLSGMQTLWINISGLMGGDAKQKMDETIKNLRFELLLIREQGGEEIPINIYGALVELNENLYYLRQRKGMGIEVTRNVSEEQRLNQAFL